MLTRFANEVLDEVLFALSLDECELPPEAPVYEPVCDGCASEEPVVFCWAHGVRLCSRCFPCHAESGCRYISMAVAREWAAQAVAIF